MDYWHNLIAEKSWNVLQQLKGKFDFILIGGWASYLWTKASKSKDLDIVVQIETLDAIKKYYPLRKNDRLCKYEIKIDEIDIDIYVPFYSRLALPLEAISFEMIEGFKVIKTEELLVLKQGAEHDRGFSEKGEKDRIDIMSLVLFCDIDFKRYKEMLKSVKKDDLIDSLIAIIRNFQDYKYLSLTPRELKKKKQEVLNRLRRL